MGKDIAVTKTQDLIVYSIISPMSEIPARKTFIALTILDIILAIYLDYILPFPAWLGLVIVIPVQTALLKKRPFMKLEFNPSERKLRCKDKYGQSEWKFIATNCKVIYTIDTDFITYRYPRDEVAGRGTRYIGNLEIRDDKENVRFFLSPTFSKSKNSILWMGHIARILAKELNLMTGGINKYSDVEVKIPYPTDDD